MQFKPNYEPFHRAIDELIESLTPRQHDKYMGQTGYFADRLVKVSKSKSMITKIEAIEDLRDQCREAYYTWYDQFKDNFTGILKARVDWFNQASGEGMVTIIGKDGTEVSSVIHACNIKGKKTWYPETACVYYTKGQDIEVELSFHGYCSQIFVKGVTQGHFDKEGWDNLDQNKLAFKCDDDGKAINGLFSS